MSHRHFAVRRTPGHGRSDWGLVAERRRAGMASIHMTEEDIIARLAALVPKPRVNLTRFHGVFAPNSKYRARVTPAKRGGEGSVLSDGGWGGTDAGRPPCRR